MGYIVSACPFILWLLGRSLLPPPKSNQRRAYILSARSLKKPSSLLLRDKDYYYYWLLSVYGFSQIITTIIWFRGCLSTSQLKPNEGPACVLTECYKLFLFIFFAANSAKVKANQLCLIKVVVWIRLLVNGLLLIGQGMSSELWGVSTGTDLNCLLTASHKRVGCNSSFCVPEAKRQQLSSLFDCDLPALEEDVKKIQESAC
uniref:Uncharacterized protein n=1 Tax=Ditylenchus dipsaci TaxID=166011 RepID=A0A915E0U4_9BILA